jgi:hypothetical protein
VGRNLPGGGSWWRLAAAIAIALAIGGACIANADIKQQDKLTAPDGAANNQFGTAVAVDGHTLVVAAPFKTVGANSNQGALYVYSDEDTGSWEKVATLTAKTGDAGDTMGWTNYGSGIAISGNTIVASTFGRTSGKCGAYVFTRKGSEPSGWAKASQDQLQASDADFSFHCSVGPVAISGDNLALAGLHSVNPAGHANGSVYVFKRSNQGDWTQKQRLVEGNDACCNHLGEALAMDGDNLVVTDENIAYVYGLQGGTFRKTATLHPPETNYSFGASAAISGQTVVIGSDHVPPDGTSNAAYVYSAGGNMLAKLTDPKGIGNEGQNHAASVATDGDLVIEGNPVQPAKGHISDSTNYTGMVDVWTKPPGGWSSSSHAIQVYADDAEPQSSLGGAVAMTSKELFAGSPRRTVGANSQQGAAYIFGFVSKVVLKVEESGSGDGAVKSDPPGINCGKMCRASFEPGANVKLTADPGKGSKFAGWSGSGCSGDNPKCKVAMNVSRTIKAKFADKH